MNAGPVKPLPTWLRVLAWGTVLAALPLLLLGAQVTTMGVGMVDPRGFRPPWFFFQEFLRGHGLGWLVEHGHRLAGFVVGLCAIVLAVGLAVAGKGRSDGETPQRNHPARWLGVLVLAVVSLQGTLGIFRIELNAALGQSLKLIHGCFAQVVFALLVVTAVLAGRSQASEEQPSPEPGLRQSAHLLTIAVFVQLLFGGLVRHLDQPLLGRLHLLMAFLVMGLAVWFARLVLESEARGRLVRPMVFLMILLGVQLWLGVESWLSKFFNAGSAWNMLQPLQIHLDLVRSLHYVTGTLLFAITIVAMLRTRPRTAAAPAPVPSGRWEGAA